MLGRVYGKQAIDLFNEVMHSPILFISMVAILILLFIMIRVLRHRGESTKKKDTRIVEVEDRLESGSKVRNRIVAP
jgi:hypothetical protein